MGECRYCRGGITWRKDGERNIPYNLDGTQHRCQKDNTPVSTETSETVIGRLESHQSGSATFSVKGGTQKIYALSADRYREWLSNGFHASMWLSITLDKNKFIQGATPVDAPEWAAGWAVGPIVQQTGEQAGTERSADSCTSPGNQDPEWRAKAVELAVQHHSVTDTSIEEVLETAEKFHAFIRGKVGGA